jgi:glycosyltransferase involved in cell wall biosynthesis
MLGKASDVSVTVIITCFNLEKYIALSIGSVLNQSHRGAVEIIVVDDCSVDNSASIIKKFDSVKYYKTNVNSGVLLATVMGLRHASGDVVFFLDGDDEWCEEKLSRSVPRFCNDPDLSFLTHDIFYISGEGLLLETPSRCELTMKGVSPTDEHDMIQRGILHLKDYVWLGSAFAVRRARIDVDSFIAWAEQLPVPKKTYQDWPLAYWVATRRGAKMGYVAAKLMRYRLHETNSSGSASTVLKTLSNLEKGLNTSLAMRSLAGASLNNKVGLAAIEGKTDYYRYLIDLYNGRRLSAGVRFFRNIPYIIFQEKSFTKEVIRFCGILALGPESFTKMLRGQRRPK